MNKEELEKAYKEYLEYKNRIIITLELMEIFREKHNLWNDRDINEMEDILRGK